SMSRRAQRVGVIGAGAWGTALALVAARAGHHVVLWARGQGTSDAINASRENTERLPGIRLPDMISVTSIPADLAVSELVLIATPAQAMREVIEQFRPHLYAGVPAIIAAKGIEQGTSRLMTEVLRESCPDVEPMV